LADSRYAGFGRYPLENAALGLLIPGPRHGYGLHQDFAEAFGSIWKAGQTKFYLVLTELEKEGLLGATTEPQEGRPPRKVYHLTEKGRQAFLDWLHQPVRSMRVVRVEFIARLRFFNLLKLPGAADLIDRQIAVFEGMLAEWSQEDPGPDPFEALVDDFRTRQARFLIDWLHACRAQIDAGLFPAG
jgi:DNA-binding PadR family transcriptional regulator